MSKIIILTNDSNKLFRKSKKVIVFVFQEKPGEGGASYFRMFLEHACRKKYEYNVQQFYFKSLFYSPSYMSTLTAVLCIGLHM